MQLEPVPSPSDPTDQAITLPLNCVHCGRPVSLQFTNTRSVINIETIWTCPHPGCPTLEGQRIEFPGELLELWMGHGDPPENLWR
jgi:hypothetical protein